MVTLLELYYSPCSSIWLWCLVPLVGCATLDRNVYLEKIRVFKADLFVSEYSCME